MFLRFFYELESKRHSPLGFASVGRSVQCISVNVRMVEIFLMFIRKAFVVREEILNFSFDL